jgi:hypothetical protein
MTTIDTLMTLADEYASLSYMDGLENRGTEDPEVAVSRATLHAALTDMCADSLRYQWLREGNFTGKWLLAEVSGGWSDGMDAAIDAAMKRG